MTRRMQGLQNKKPAEPENQPEEQEKGSFGKRAQAMRDKLKLGPHHKMERFTVMLSATLSFLLLFTVISFVTYRADVKKNVSAQAVYTEDFTFSLSDQRMAVKGIYGDKEHTDVMVLLQIQNPDAMSADASNYELFITGENGSLSYEPDVTFSLFGATGYAVIRFQHDEPIPKEIANITIRANAELSDKKAPPSDDSVGDASFQKYDQGQLFVNPGADDIKTLSWLKSGETDPMKLYTALVAEARDQEIRAAIKKETDTIKQLLNRENEYANRLRSAGYVPPTSPWFMAGDYVDDDGTFVAAENLYGAFVFDYATKDIRDGYVNQVMSDISKFDEYMAEQEEKSVAAERSNHLKEENVKRQEVVNVEVIKDEDGKSLDLQRVVTGNSPSAQVSAKGSVESLQQTWRAYLTSKTKLQRSLMRDLLILDADVLSQKSSYSVNENKKAVQFY